MELYEITIRNHIEPNLGNEKICNIEPIDIQNLYLMKREQNIGNRTILVMHTIINHSLDMAVKAGALLSNPAQLVSPPRYSSPEMDFYSEHEITQLLLAVKGTSLEALIHLAITTGMRQSELLALKWSDVDWDRNTITVQRQLRRNYEDHNYFSSLKTQAGKRTISLGNNTIQKLIEHHKSQKNEIERMGNQWVDNNLFFHQ
jgi:integrase